MKVQLSCRYTQLLHSLDRLSRNLYLMAVILHGSEGWVTVSVHQPFMQWWMESTLYMWKSCQVKYKPVGVFRFTLVGAELLISYTVSLESWAGTFVLQEEVYPYIPYPVQIIVSSNFRQTDAKSALKSESDMILDSPLAYMFFTISLFEQLGNFKIAFLFKKCDHALAF